MVAGYGCGLCPSFVGKWEGKEKEKVSGKKISKIFFSPIFAFAGEKKLHCAIKNSTVQFFFEEKEKNLGVTQKWVMTRLTHHLSHKVQE
jgi:hypothetical protein